MLNNILEGGWRELDEGEVCCGAHERLSQARQLTCYNKGASADSQIHPPPNFRADFLIGSLLEFRF